MYTIKKNLTPPTRIAVTFFLWAPIKNKLKRGKKLSSQATYIGSTVLFAKSPSFRSN